MKLNVVVLLISLVSVSAMADEINYADWERLNKMASEPSHKPSYLPDKMNPVTDPNGVVQQIINFNIDVLKRTTATGRMLDTTWGGDKTIAAKATIDEAPKTTYSVKPFETKGWINFSNKMKASFNYQILNHTAELLITPEKKIWGMKVGYSYQITSADSRNLLSVRLDW